MAFLETLKSLGCVKPCDNCNQDNFECQKYIFCHKCEQKLAIDLAPLLAKPKELGEVLREHLTFFKMTDAQIAAPSDLGMLYIVGPQRAHSLVYEVARQLGGTAAVAELTTYQKVVEYPEGIDKEVIPLCDALNSIPGVMTCYSCSGHSKDDRRFHVAMRCYSDKAIKDVLYLVNPRRYSGQGAGEKGCSWSASAYEPHGDVKVVLDIQPNSKSSLLDDILMAVGDLITEIKWLQDRKEIGRWQDRECCLSLPIPPDATVLFVTDRVDEKEMRGVAESVNRLDGVLPYLLCLVSNGGEEMAEARCIDNGIVGSRVLKIISLHQEKS